MGLKKYTIIISYFLTICSYTQHLNKTSYDSIINTNISDKEKTILIERLLNADAINKLDEATIYYEFSKWNWRRDQKRAKKYAKKAFALLSKSRTENLELYKKNLFNLAYFYSRTRFPDYANALKYFNILIEASNESETRLGKVYREKGNIYDELGDFHKALENYEKSEMIFKKRSNNKELLKTCINIAATYANLKDSSYMKPFLENVKTINNIKKEISIKRSQQIKLFLNTGAIYNTTKNFKRSLSPYNNALKLAKEENDSVLIASTLNNIGVYYKKNKNLDKAKQLFEEAKNHIVNSRLLKSSYYNNMADLFLVKEDYRSALLNYNEAISILLISDEKNNKSITDLPDLESIKTVPYTKDILEYLIDKAFAWRKYYDNTFEINHLLEEEKTIDLIDQIIDMLYFESREDLSKLFWREKGAKLYMEAVSVCYELGKPQKALYFMEKNKGLLLLENISNVKAKLYAGIPSTLTNREDKLINTIKDLQGKLTNKELSLERKEEIKSKIYRFKSKYEKFIDSLEIEFPQYKKFKNKVRILSSKEIQNTLAKNELSVEYILGNNKGYAMLIAKDDLQFKKIDSLQSLYKDMALFNDKIEKPFLTQNSIIEYNKTASKLFKRLFPFKNITQKLQNHKLIIIPDGSLHRISFEALVVSDIDSTTSTYLIQNTPVYYKYSFSAESKIKTEETSVNRIAGFMPIHFKNDYLPPLKNSALEQKAITPFFKKQIFTNDQASKQRFIETYNKNNMIHVSTHGGVDIDQPWLAFYDEKLFFNELYFLKTSKDLVVLSACKTSAGKDQKGEGQFSLTRGFINSGTKSIISTLWDVNEKASSEIIVSFYKNIKLNKNKSDALREAKLFYLKKYKNTSQSSPYYWSSIILTGSDDSMASSLNYRSLTIYGVIIILFFLIYILNKK